MNTQDRTARGHQPRYRYQPPPLPTDTIKLAALHAAYPDFTITVTSIGGLRCYQALRARGDGPLLSIASTSVIDLWRILRAHTSTRAVR
jgi:hypothetical protein